MEALLSTYDCFVPPPWPCACQGHERDEDIMIEGLSYGMDGPRSSSSCSLDGDEKTISPVVTSYFYNIFVRITQYNIDTHNTHAHSFL
jgi:hypothetical protein